MKTLILLIVAVAGFIAGAAVQHSQDRAKLLNLRLTPITVIQDGVPLTLQFDEEIVLSGKQIDIMEAH